MILNVDLADARRKFGMTEIDVIKCLLNLSEGNDSYIINVKKDWDRFEFTATSHINRVLNKLELIDVITKRSLGAKGTHIKINNREALEFIAGGKYIC